MVLPISVPFFSCIGRRFLLQDDKLLQDYNTRLPDGVPLFSNVNVSACPPKASKVTDAHLLTDLLADWVYEATPLSCIQRFRSHIGNICILDVILLKTFTWTSDCLNVGLSNS